MAAKKKLTRDEAKELYKDFQEAMKKMQSNQSVKATAESSDVAVEIANAIKASMRKDDQVAEGRQHPSREQKITTKSQQSDASASILLEPSITTAASFAARFNSSKFFGASAAFSAFVFLLLMKVAVAVLELSGVTAVDNANATVVSLEEQMQLMAGNRYEKAVLDKLDQRRAELEGREKEVEAKESALADQQRVFSVRLLEMKELTNRLKQHRESKNREEDAQLEQLANIYGSMNPNEAAALLEQLDTTIALELLGRMPGKRIGQILALMSAERALTLTKMLSGKGE